MKLIIEKKNYYSINFITYLLNIYKVRVKALLYKNIDNIKIMLKEYDIKDIDLFINVIISSIKILENDKEYIITLDKNINFRRDSIQSYASFIEYGNMQYKGLHIFGEVNQYIVDNIGNIFHYYLLTGGDDTWL